jgi:hypothetical protein
MLRLDEELVVLRASRKFDETPFHRPVLSQPMLIGAFASFKTDVSTRPTSTNEYLYRTPTDTTVQNVRVRINNVNLDHMRRFVHEGEEV